MADIGPLGFPRFRKGRLDSQVLHVEPDEDEFLHCLTVSGRVDDHFESPAVKAAKPNIGIGKALARRVIALRKMTLLRV